MELRLEQVDKQVGPSMHLYPLSLKLEPHAVTVLLGATQAGKTSLMRLMAGLDAPTHGRVTVDGKDVTGVAVRERNVSMVYQQFINYPSMTVFDNIASPLRLAKQQRGTGSIETEVTALAKRLHIDPFLQRLPAELSGGQQQRVALARALAKGAPLMLLDEPLVNLDYKLREELRDELSTLFATGDSTVVYATTEPTEALLLGGYCAVLDRGEVLQYGPTAEVFHRPKSIRVASAFSDPPMNLLRGHAATLGLSEVGSDVTVGIRASALRVVQRPGDVVLQGHVELAEISGSDTFVHVSTPVGELVAQLTGVHYFELAAAVTLYLDPAQTYVFDAQGELLRAPALRRP